MKKLGLGLLLLGLSAVSGEAGPLTRAPSVSPKAAARGRVGMASAAPGTRLVPALILSAPRAQPAPDRRKSALPRLKSAAAAVAPAGQADASTDELRETASKAFDQLGDGKDGDMRFPLPPPKDWKPGEKSGPPILLPDVPTPKTGDVIMDLATAISAARMPKKVEERAYAEWNKLAKMNPKSEDFGALVTYLQWMTETPWSMRTPEQTDLAAAEKGLNARHSGMAAVKDRIMDLVAVSMQGGLPKGKIICLVGPPGVGKTSIASSIAKALNRRFVRLSLGGVHDETVLRGHNRTYVRSQPGAIIRKMKEAGVVNPVFLLDEIDKLGKNSHNGDPSAAMLEILDPEQNSTFRDEYLDVPYDLSKALFIITANYIDQIPEALRDRLEIIELEGYTDAEKVEIAGKYLVPQAQTASNLKPGEAAFTPAALTRVVAGYTREAGVRRLTQLLEEITRKVASWKVRKSQPAPALIDEGQIAQYLGKPVFEERETAQNGLGLATGLSVGPGGGNTLNVEAVRYKGVGKVTLRRQMLEMTDDSAHNAIAYIRANAEKLGIGGVDFTRLDVEIALTPAGKVDGPSAGTAIVTALASLFTGRKVKPGIAMTGEITLSGRVLRIGGLKQKVMAAVRDGCHTVAYPAGNQADVDSIPKAIRDKIRLVPVSTVDELLALALEPAKT